MRVNSKTSRGDSLWKGIRTSRAFGSSDRVQYVIDRRSLHLVGADGNPADLPIRSNDERCRMCDIESIGADGVMYSVRPCHLPGFIEKDTERILMLLDVFFSFEKPFDFLGGDHQQAGAA